MLSQLSLVKIEDEALSRLKKVTRAQADAFIAAHEQGNSPASLPLGEKSKKIMAEFVEDIWEDAVAQARGFNSWGRLAGRKRPRIKKPKPLLLSEPQPPAQAKSLTRNTLDWDYLSKAGKPTAVPLPYLSLAQIPMEEGLNWYKDYALKLVGVAQQDLLDAAKKTVSESARLGLTQRETREELGRVFESFPRHRLNAIIRTESSHIYNTGATMSFARNDSVVAYRYIVTVDDRTSEICLDFVDKVVPAAELSDVPPLHFSCRTVLEPIYDWEDWEASDMAGAQPMEGFEGTPILK